MTVDILIITIFFIVNIIIGSLAGKKTNNLRQFSVGHRAFSTFAIFATLTASFIGGGYTIGNASKVYSAGLMYSFALLGFSLKEILVARYIAPKMDAHRDCLSIGDIIQKRYGASAKLITGIFSMIVCGGILGAQVGAMGTIFNQFFYISPVIGILIGFGILIFYSAVGGMRAVVHTDILQFAILITGIPLTFFIGLHHVGGFAAIQNAVPHDHIMFIQNKQDVFAFVSLFITFIFGETLIPPYVQRLFMAKSSLNTERGTLYSGLISIPFFIIVGAIGLIAFVLNPNIDPNAALPYVVHELLPIGIRGFVIAGILSVIMSSAAGFLNAGAVSFVNDIVKPLHPNTLSEKTLFWMARLSTVLLGVIAVIFALAISNLLDILLYAYNFWSPIIIIPLGAAMLGIPAHKKDFLAGALFGISASLVWAHFFQETTHFSGLVVGVAANFVAFTISYRLFKPTDSGVFAPAPVRERSEQSPER